MGENPVDLEQIMVLGSNNLARYQQEAIRLIKLW